MDKQIELVINLKVKTLKISIYTLFYTFILKFQEIKGS